MKNINQENSHIMTKMRTSLKSLSTKPTPFEEEDWLLSNFEKLNNQVQLQAHYSIKIGENHVNLEQGDYLSLKHAGLYQCSSCLKKIKKIYSGFCYVCLTKKACADMCLLNPFRCHFSHGTCREPQWGLNFCYQPHYVYLSYTDKYKVGITRKNQILSRWVDQGATMGSPLCLVNSRHQAGQLEKALTEILSDKSHWQKMLKGGNESPSSDEFYSKQTSVLQWLKEILNTRSNLIVPFQTTTNPNEANIPLNPIQLFESPACVKIHFPVPEKSEKIKSISLEKMPAINQKITGIKGQYLFFEDQVFNMRSHEGFVVQLEKY